MASAGIDTWTLIGLTLCCEGSTCGGGNGEGEVGAGARVLSWEPVALGTPLGDTSSWEAFSPRGCSLPQSVKCACSAFSGIAIFGFGFTS